MVWCLDEESWFGWYLGLPSAREGVHEFSTSYRLQDQVPLVLVV